MPTPLQSSEAETAQSGRKSPPGPGAWGRSLPHDKAFHLACLIVSALLIATPALLRFSAPSGKVEIPCLSFELPPTCASHVLWGRDCPGCGLIRAFVLIVHGHPAESIRYHRLGLFVYAFLVIQVVFHAHGLRHLGEPIGPRLALWHQVLLLAIVGLLTVNWLAGLFLGGN